MVVRLRDQFIMTGVCQEANHFIMDKEAEAKSKLLAYRSLYKLQSSAHMPYFLLIGPSFITSPKSIAI